MTLLVLLFSGMLLTPTYAPPASLHKFHVSYGQMAVEDNVAFARIRFFRGDLETALRAYADEDDVTLAPDVATDSLFTRYFNEHFALTANGMTIPGEIVSSGEETGDVHPMWWYEVQFQAPAPLRTFTIRNALLFDTFSDQRNQLKVRYFPDEREKSLYFVDGAEVYDVSF